jgi:hypothetical protein
MATPAKHTFSSLLIDTASCNSSVAVITVDDSASIALDARRYEAA